MPNTKPSIQKTADTKESIRLTTETLKGVVAQTETMSDTINKTSDTMLEVHAKASANDDVLKKIEETVQDNHKIQQENQGILTKVNESTKIIETNVATARESAEKVSKSNLNLMENFSEQANIWENIITTSNKGYQDEVVTVSELLKDIKALLKEQDPRETTTNILKESKELKKEMTALVEQQRKDTASFNQQMATNKKDMATDTDRFVKAVKEINGYNENFKNIQASLETITLRLNVTTDTKETPKQA